MVFKQHKKYNLGIKHIYLNTKKHIIYCQERTVDYHQESKPDEKQNKFKEIAVNLNKKVWNMTNKIRASLFFTAGKFAL